MSKSKGNTVDPQEMIEQYGADTVRLFMMFTAPPEQTLEWNDAGVEGAHRFIKRLWKAVHSHIQSGSAPTLDTSSLTKEQQDLRRKTHETIQKVTDDMGRRQTFNTAIAAVMELTNSITRFDVITDQDRASVQEALESCVLLLSPIIPHVTHEMWSALGHESTVMEEAWPEFDESALVKSVIEVVVQVNGKVRAKIEVSPDAAKEDVEALALADEHVQKFTDGKTVRKVIVVPGKLVNIVAN